MGIDIKMRLLALGKTQTDLLLVLHEKGFTGIDKSRLSLYIRGIMTNPQQKKALKIIYETLDMWEKEVHDKFTKMELSKELLPYNIRKDV